MPIQEGAVLKLIESQGNCFYDGFLDGLLEAPEDVISHLPEKQAAYLMGLRLGKALIRREMVYPAGISLVVFREVDK